LLPEAWDTLASSFFQTRAFLAHAERTNPCGQRYYTLEPAGRVTAGAVVYDIRLDLLTYRGIRSPLPMCVLGLPCSVGVPGLLGPPADHLPLLRTIRDHEPGLLWIGLNLEAPLAIQGLPQGPTLPTAVLRRPFADLAAYRRTLRSDYRRRFDRIRTAFEGVREDWIPCAAFDADMYRLYHEAWTRSDARLELLPRPFFEGLPEPFSLTRFERGGRLVAWHLCAFEPGCCTFFMGGVEQATKERHRAYHNLLFSVLERAFAAGCGVVDLGQTAEIAKTRAGAVLEARHMFAWPRFPPLRSLMRRAEGLLAWRGIVPTPRVFGNPG
jgi:hypothetical protein